MVATLGTEGPIDWLLRPFGAARLVRTKETMDAAEFNRRARIAAGLTGVSTAAVCFAASANGLDPFQGPAFLLNTAAISFAVITRLLSLWEP